MFYIRNSIKDMETKVTLSIDFGYKNVGVPNEEKTTKDFTPVAAVEKK